MIRRPFLSRTYPAALCVLVAIAAVPAARAQDAATAERLDRLERDLSMLQRQVYHGGGEAAPGAVSSGNTAVDLQVRMDRLEQQIRDLTGRIEGETNQVQQLSQRLEQVNSDIEVRLGEGQGRQAGSPPPRAAAAAWASAPPPSLADPAAPVPAFYGRPPPPPLPPPGYGTLTPPGPAIDAAAPYAGPTQLTPSRAASAADTLRPPGSDMPSGSASEQYNAAFGLLRKADYEGAEDALRSFIRRHPNDPLAGNAQYWLGESYYARGKYTEAAAAFADGYKRYPKGPKAPDELLKLGMSLDHANQKHNACIALTQLDHDFPHPGNAVKDRAAQEKKKLGC